MNKGFSVQQVSLPVWYQFGFICGEPVTTPKELELHKGLPILKENGLELITLEDIAFLELAGGLPGKKPEDERKLSFDSVREFPSLASQKINTASLYNIWVAESCVYNPEFPDDVLIARPPFNPILNVLDSLQRSQLADLSVNPLARSTDNRDNWHLSISDDEYTKIRDNASSDPSVARKTGVFLMSRHGLFSEDGYAPEADLSKNRGLTDIINFFLFGDYAFHYIRALGDYSLILKIDSKRDVIDAAHPIANQIYIDRIGTHNQINGDGGFLIIKEMGIIGVRRNVSLPGQIFYVRMEAK